jgi:hypothetical protein
MILSAGRAVHAGGDLRQLSEHAGLGLDCGQTAPPVVGHLIITKLIRYPRISDPLFPLGWNPWIVTA